MSSQIFASATVTINSSSSPAPLSISDTGVTQLTVRANDAGIYIGTGGTAGANFQAELPDSGYELTSGVEYTFTLGPQQYGTSGNNALPYVATTSATDVTLSWVASTRYCL